MGSLLLNRRSHCSPMPKNVLARWVRFFRIKDDGVRWSANMRVAGVDAGIDHRDLQTVAHRFILLMLRPFLRLRAVALALRVGLAFAAAHFIDGCALSGLHSQPLIAEQF